MVVGLLSNAMAATDNDGNTVWTGTGTDWATAGNWDQGVPTATDNAKIITGGNLASPTISADAEFGSLLVGDTVDLGTCVLNMNGGTFGAGSATIGNASGGVGSMNMSAGTFTPWLLNIGLGAGATGTMTQSDGHTYSAAHIIGQEGTGTLNLSGGMSDYIYWGTNGYMSGSVGTINQTGGVFGNQSTGIYGAWNAGSTGTHILDGGTIDMMWYGAGILGDYTFVQRGGELNLTSSFILAQQGGDSRAYMYGGVANVGAISPGTGFARIDITHGKFVIPDVNGEIIPKIYEAMVTDGIITGYGYADLSHVIIAWDWMTNTTSITAIPEPATIALLGLGGLVLLRRRKR